MIEIIEQPLVLFSTQENTLQLHGRRKRWPRWFKYRRLYERRFTFVKPRNLVEMYRARLTAEWERQWTSIVKLVGRTSRKSFGPNGDLTRELAVKHRRGRLAIGEADPNGFYAVDDYAQEVMPYNIYGRPTYEEWEFCDGYEWEELDVDQFCDWSWEFVFNDEWFWRIGRKAIRTNYTFLLEDYYYFEEAFDIVLMSTYFVFVTSEWYTGFAKNRPYYLYWAVYVPAGITALDAAINYFFLFFSFVAVGIYYATATGRYLRLVTTEDLYIDSNVSFSQRRASRYFNILQNFS